MAKTHAFRSREAPKKSDMTPVDPLPPARPALSCEDRQSCKLIEAAQKAKLVGFTARELKTMGAFAYFESPMATDSVEEKRRVGPSDLSIASILHRAQSRSCTAHGRSHVRILLSVC
jgi:hypothetical protein